MARTQIEIEQEILQARSSYTELAEQNSVSQTAMWRLWVKVMTFAHFILEKLFDVFRDEINNIITLNRTGTLLWYAEKAKEFQNGSVLNAFGEYDTIDATKRIITRVAVSEITGGVSIKIAKGEPATQLNATELQSFTQYANQIKFAGVATSIVNLPAEAVIVDLQIFYKDISESTAKQAVKDAISEYAKSVAFDGQFVINDVISLCRQKLGVSDVLVSTIEINGNTVTDGRYSSLSGYYSFDAEDLDNNYQMNAL